MACNLLLTVCELVTSICRYLTVLIHSQHVDNIWCVNPPVVRVIL